MRNSQREKGFTLVEIVVSSILLAIIAAGVFSITISSKKIINVSSQRHAANELAEAAMDNLRKFLGDDNWIGNSASPFSAPDSVWQPSGGPPDYYYFTDGQVAYDGYVDRVADVFRGTELDTRYNARWRFRVIVDGSYDYRKVEVEVVWNETQL
ncbi:PilW family protein [Candidatus Omnitrophota bacterium]